MNKSIWSKYHNNHEWINQYRIPSIDEFIEGFTFEFAENKQSINNGITADWKLHKVDQSTSKEWLIQPYGLQKCLEEGYIRTSDERSNKFKSINMRFYYAYVRGTEVVTTKYGTKVLDGSRFNYGRNADRPVNKIILSAVGIYSSLHAESLIYNMLKGTDLSERNDNPALTRLRKSLLINGKDYTLDSEMFLVETIDEHLIKHGAFSPLHCKSLDEIFIYSRSGTEQVTMLDKLIDSGLLAHLKPIEKSIVTNNIKAGQMKATKKEVIPTQEVKPKVTPRLGFMSNMRARLKDIAIKYQIISPSTESRYADGVWKPVKHNRVVTPLSEERLVYIALKDRSDCIKVKHNVATEKIKEDSNWEFVSKEVGKKLHLKLNKVRIGSHNTLPTSAKFPRVYNKRRNVKTKQVPVLDETGKVISSKTIKYQVSHNPTYTPMQKKPKVDQKSEGGTQVSKVKNNATTRLKIGKKQVLRPDQQYSIRIITPEGKVTTKLVTEYNIFEYQKQPLHNPFKKTNKWKCPMKKKK